MPQGHPLRPAGRTTGVQDEGDVVGLRRRDAAYLATRAIALERQPAGIVDLALNYRRSRRQRLPRVGAVLSRRKQEARARVLEIEAELGLFVRGVQRAGRPDPGRRQEQD